MKPFFSSFNVPVSRRELLKAGGWIAAASVLPLRFAWASTPNNARLMVVIQRGAMDGLGAVIPYRDPHYTDARGPIATPLTAENIIDLDGFFAFPTALNTLAPLFKSKEMLILHATATPYRERSHFDAQDLLENGSTKPHELTTGWLNRALQALPSHPQALALGPDVPLLLRGGGNVTSWDPSPLKEVDQDFRSRVAHMYHDDPVLSKALQESESMQNISMQDMGVKNARSFPSMMTEAAKFMSAAGGPTIASIDIGGWDTHVNQGTDKGRLPNALQALAEGLNNFRTGMGSAWTNTTVLVITEFGRTVRGNGTGGTDHGTASTAFLLGGNVNGGRVIGDWPGLAKLYQDRDLMPANDLRALLKGTLQAQLGIADTTLSETVFPGSIEVPAYTSLLKNA